MKGQKDVCELCERVDVETTVHHLIPKEEGGNKGPTADLCIPCHKNVHALYTNQELALRLSTIEALKADERVSKFVKWIQKQPSSVLIRTKRSHDKTMKKARK